MIQLTKSPIPSESRMTPELRKMYLGFGIVVTKWCCCDYLTVMRDKISELIIDICVCVSLTPLIVLVRWKIVTCRELWRMLYFTPENATMTMHASPTESIRIDLEFHHPRKYTSRQWQVKSTLSTRRTWTLRMSLLSCQCSKVFVTSSTNTKSGASASSKHLATSQR